jgi:hypothetical protein
MGQQQLLLIVLGIIIIGLSIAVGISVAATSSVQANRDGVLSDLQNLSALARQHYIRPVVLGGGGYTFREFVIPDELDTTGNGIYQIDRLNRRGDELRILGIGREIGNDGTDPIRFRIKIKLDEIEITEQN